MMKFLLIFLLTIEDKNRKPQTHMNNLRICGFFSV